MIILGLDPGPTTTGWALYDADARRVLASASAATTEEVLDMLGSQGLRLDTHEPDLVAIERVQSYRITKASLLDTSMVAGRFQQRALDAGYKVALLYRLDILRVLDVTGTGSRDALVRQRLIEMHPGGTGRAKAPGPLYGVASHGWQALAVAVSAGIMTGRIVVSR